MTDKAERREQAPRLCTACGRWYRAVRMANTRRRTCLPCDNVTRLTRIRRADLVPPPRYIRGGAGLTDDHFDG